MIEIKTRTFRVEKDEDFELMMDFVRKMHGYIAGTITSDPYKRMFIVAEFKEKII